MIKSLQVLCVKNNMQILSREDRCGFQTENIALEMCDMNRVMRITEIPGYIKRINKIPMILYLPFITQSELVNLDVKPAKTPYIDTFILYIMFVFM